MTMLVEAPRKYLMKELSPEHLSLINSLLRQVDGDVTIADIGRQTWEPIGKATGASSEHSWVQTLQRHYKFGRHLLIVRDSSNEFADRYALSDVVIRGIQDSLVPGSKLPIDRVLTAARSLRPTHSPLGELEQALESITTEST